MKKPKCSECKRELKHYEGGFAATYDQYEGRSAINARQSVATAAGLAVAAPPAQRAAANRIQPSLFGRGLIPHPG